MAEIKIEVRAIDLERLGINLCFINTDSAERKEVAARNAQKLYEAFVPKTSLDHFIDDVEAAEKRDAWQPIETAPKTTRAILVWCPAIKCTFAVSWHEDAWLFFGGSGYLRDYPSLWMPMPTPRGDQP